MIKFLHLSDTKKPELECDGNVGQKWDESHISERHEPSQIQISFSRFAEEIKTNKKKIKMKDLVLNLTLYARLFHIKFTEFPE